MVDNHKLKFKEVTPEITVKKIRDILKSMNIEVIEEFQAENEIDTYSLRISLKGASGIGANGKGTTKMYALASAYAEFLERLQNMRMSPLTQLYRIYKRKSSKFFAFEKEKILTGEELVKENNAFIQMFLQRRGLSNAPQKDKVQALLNVQKMDFKVLKEYNKYICIPYYSIKNKTYCNIPYFISSRFYASNGMCAGNSISEALVQGISEIMERNANSRSIIEKTSFPDIPVSVIKRYPDVFNMYLKVKENPKYRMFIKDASYGGTFPIVCFILLENNTGKFGVKFGAHSDLGIALERVFTEATQGITLDEFCNKSKISFLNEFVDYEKNMINSFRTSNAQYPYQILLDSPDYNYYDFPMVNHLTNNDLLKIEMKKLLDHGYDILINDCSYTGFKSFHLIIPGLSEVGTNSDEIINSVQERLNLQEALLNPQLINDQICKMLIKNLKDAYGSVYEHTLYYFSGVYSNYKYYGSNDYIDLLYLIIVCALKVKNLELASEVIHFINNDLFKNKSNIDIDYIMLEKYIDGLTILKSHDDVIKYMYNMFDYELCNNFDMRFRDLNKIIENNYPSIDIDHEYCDEFLRYEEMICKFKNYQKEHSIDNSELIQTLDKLYI